MKSTFDVIVIGLGAMGSAAAHHLARQRTRVLGLEAFTPGHDRGSSHGDSRIIRQSYSEGPAYVPLVLRAYELWRELEEESGEELLKITGGVAIGPEHGVLVSGCLKSAAQHRLAHDLFGPAEMKRRFPQFALAEDEVAFYEQNAGYLRPEECIRQHLRCAAMHGAELHFEEAVISWTASASGSGVTVTTGRQTYSANSLVISVGPWFAEIVPDISMPTAVQRRVTFWMEPLRDSSSFDAGVFPVFMWEPKPELLAPAQLFYGIPRTSALGHPKVAIHSAPAGQLSCTPATIDRAIHADDEEAVRSAIARRIPALNGTISRAATCMYTMTADEHFIIDLHPEYPQVSLAAGFSGHGFKFSAVIGELLSQLAIGRKAEAAISLFSGSRFGSHS